MELSKFGDVRILVVGDLMLDRYWWGSVSRISPEAPVPIVLHERTSLAPGGAANVAANVSSMGGKALILGCLGRDEAASQLTEVLTQYGVDLSGLMQLDSRPTTVKTRLIAHNQQIARIDSEEVAPLEETHCELVNDRIEAIIDRVDAVIISDYAKGFLTRRVLAHLVQAAGQRSIPVLVDPKGKDFSKYTGAAFITPNRREALDACKIDENEANAVELAGTMLLREHEFEGVLVTEGENGMTLFQKEAEPVHIPAVEQEVYDVTGAGDTVIACFAMAVGSGMDPVSAARLANIAAGISVKHVGAAVIRREELMTAAAEGVFESQGRVPQGLEHV